MRLKGTPNPPFYLSRLRIFFVIKDMKHQIGDTIRFIKFCRYCNNYYGGVEQGVITEVNKQRKSYVVQHEHKMPSFTKTSFNVYEHTVIQKLNI